MAEKILTSKSAVDGERKQVTVLFAGRNGSMELLPHPASEEAHEILDPVLEQMMKAVHGYQGTVNQVMATGIMALIGASLDREDHTEDCHVFFESLTAARARQEGERDVLLKEPQQLALAEIPERESRRGDVCERSTPK